MSCMESSVKLRENTSIVICFDVCTATSLHLFTVYTGTCTKVLQQVHYYYCNFDSICKCCMCKPLHILCGYEDICT